MIKYVLNANTMELTYLEDNKIQWIEPIKNAKEFKETLTHLTTDLEKYEAHEVEVIEKVKINKNDIKVNPAATKKEIKEELKRFYDIDTLKITNYFDEDKDFYTDIEIQLYNNEEYIDCIYIQSFEYKNINEYDFYDLCDYFEKYVKGIKNKLKDWLENNYSYNIELNEGYHA